MSRNRFQYSSRRAPPSQPKRGRKPHPNRSSPQPPPPPPPSPPGEPPAWAHRSPPDAPLGSRIAFAAVHAGHAFAVDDRNVVALADGSGRLRLFCFDHRPALLFPSGEILFSTEDLLRISPISDPAAALAPDLSPGPLGAARALLPDPADPDRFFHLAVDGQLAIVQRSKGSFFWHSLTGRGVDAFDASKKWIAVRHGTEVRCFPRRDTLFGPAWRAECSRDFAVDDDFFYEFSSAEQTVSTFDVSDHTPVSEFQKATISKTADKVTVVTPGVPVIAEARLGNRVLVWTALDRPAVPQPETAPPVLRDAFTAALTGLSLRLERLKTHVAACQSLIVERYASAGKAVDRVRAKVEAFRRGDPGALLHVGLPSLAFRRAGALGVPIAALPIPPRELAQVIARATPAAIFAILPGLQDAVCADVQYAEPLLAAILAIDPTDKELLAQLRAATPRLPEIANKIAQGQRGTLRQLAMIASSITGQEVP
jgi:hypothetical protein